MKLIPSLQYSKGSQNTFTYENGILKMSDGKELDLTGDWAVIEWGENEDKGFVRKAVQENGEAIVTVLAYQPESRKRLRGQELKDAEAPIDLQDGDSVTFPDYLELNEGGIDNAQ